MQCHMDILGRPRQNQTGEAPTLADIASRVKTDMPERTYLTVFSVCERVNTPQILLIHMCSIRIR